MPVCKSSYIKPNAFINIMNNRDYENKLNKEFDLIVIGGGINGCGIARDASERGLSVLLLEKNDFGSGCTSASTRIIHGGLRYLEYAEFGLVRESLKEREILLRNANHLVKPLEFLLPIYKSSHRNHWIIKAGMLLYDALSFGKSLVSHKMLSVNEVKSLEPSIVDSDIDSAAVYYDCQVAVPERLCLENVLMASSNSALVLNHTEVVDIKINNGAIASIDFMDTLLNKKYSAKGKIIINASGPWVDNLCNYTHINIKKQIGATKGSHIIIKQFPLGPKHALIIQAKSDGRFFFIIPWLNYYLIGTTDGFYNGDLNDVHASKDEINYLLNETNLVLKEKKLTLDDVLYTYSGIRPLPYSGREKGKDPGSVTRNHIIHHHKNDGINNFISIIGGKITTYRNLSEQVVNYVYKKLNCEFVPTKTKDIPLIGATKGDFEKYKNTNFKKYKKKYDLDIEDDILLHIINWYGKRSSEVFDILRSDNNLGRLISAYGLDVRAQIEYSIKNELAFTITDVIRRLSLGFSENLGEDSVVEIVKYLQMYYSYSLKEIENQISDYHNQYLKNRKL